MLDDTIQQLNSTDPAQRRSAIIALANSKDPAALKRLAAIYRTDPDPAIRELALKAGRYIKQAAGDDAANRLPGGVAVQATGAAAIDPGAVPQAVPREQAVSARDAELAKNYLDSATTHHLEGDKARAVENLGKALSLNPDLRKDSFTINLIMTLTGRSVQEAMPILVHPDRRAELIAGLGGKRKLRKQQTHGKNAEKATWDNVMMDLGIYWLVITLCLIAIFVFMLKAIQDMIDSMPTSTTTDLSTLYDASVIGLVMVAVIYGITSVLSLLLQGAAIHAAATYILAGDGTLVYLYRRLVPFMTVVALGYAGVVVFLGLFSSTKEVLCIIPMIVMVGTVAMFYYMSKLVGEVYNFGAGSGCGAILIGGVLLAVVSYATNYALFSLLSGLLNSTG
ncbi:MAG TPA: HEAT repeat domain-containing protein [Aggregatilineaceae bacterium]|nr:HEAT repeat domain-containing protein [Aggregatilineaceae bacterium]